MAIQDKDKQLKSNNESHQLSRKYLENIKREQQIMSGVFHNLAYEYYLKQQQ